MPYKNVSLTYRLRIYVGELLVGFLVIDTVSYGKQIPDFWSDFWDWAFLRLDFVRCLEDVWRQFWRIRWVVLDSCSYSFWVCLVGFSRHLYGILFVAFFKRSESIISVRNTPSSYLKILFLLCELRPIIQ